VYSVGPKLEVVVNKCPYSINCCYMMVGYVFLTLLEIKVNIFNHFRQRKFLLQFSYS
jgi:hypothetical protein